MTYFDLESSTDSSEPRIGIEFSFPASTRRVALGVRDLVIGGYTYRAVAADVGEVGISSTADPRSIEISLPMSHLICQRYMANGTPPQKILVTIWRQQASTGDTEMIFRGNITSLAPDDNVGTFLVPSRSVEMVQRRLPTLTAGRACPHVLYDTNCRVVRADFQLSTTIVSVTGRVIELASIGGNPDQWGKWGDLAHALSGEAMTVVSQVGVNVTLQAPIYGAKFGDAVVLSPGCDHHAETDCLVKFDNVINHGGFPSMRTEENPFKGWIQP